MTTTTVLLPAAVGRQCLEKEHLLYSSTPPLLRRPRPRPPAALRQYVRRETPRRPTTPADRCLNVGFFGRIYTHLYNDGIYRLYREPKVLD